MAQFDWDQYPRVFEASRDEVVRGIGELVAKLCADPARRPPSDILEQEDAIAEAVRGQFPTQFADEFEGWLEAGTAFGSALQAGNVRRISTAFRTAWDGLYDLWMRLVTFLPFLLMTSVNRLPQGVIKEHSGKDLREAIKNYEDFYARNDELQRERDQRMLITNLLKFYPRLDAAHVLGEAFVFHSLLAPAGGFAGLFPPLFEAHLEFILSVLYQVHLAELG